MIWHLRSALASWVHATVACSAGCGQYRRQSHITTSSVFFSRQANIRYINSLLGDRQSISLHILSLGITPDSQWPRPLKVLTLPRG